MANGRALKIPEMPNGRNDELSPSGVMLVQRSMSNFPDTSTETKKNARMPNARALMMTVNLMVASMPTMLIHTKMT
jgi:hypothetical protein